MLSRPHALALESILIAILLSCSFLSASVAEPTFESNDMSREKLAPCPKSPNCVSSLADDSEHKIAALGYSDSPKGAFERVRKVIQSMPRSKITEDNYPYLHAEFRSLILRYVDDVEILVNTENQMIDIRSASRLGYSDLGVNRRRVRDIREKFGGESSQ